MAKRRPGYTPPKNNFSLLPEGVRGGESQREEGRLLPLDLNPFDLRRQESGRSFKSNEVAVCLARLAKRARDADLLLDSIIHKSKMPAIPSNMATQVSMYRRSSDY